MLGFEETTTSEIENQYDDYATYYSKHFVPIVTVYLETSSVRKWTADDLLCHLNEMLDKLKLPLVCIINLWMDSPSVNFLNRNWKQLYKSMIKC